MQQKQQTFNDGVVTFYLVSNTAAAGSKPNETLTYKQSLRYMERTVGITRYYAAKQANVRVDYVLRCQKRRDISTQNIAVPNDGKQYRIIQVQYPEVSGLPVMDITLEEVTAVYDIE